jgi:shikimate dehydrogenase
MVRPAMHINGQTRVFMILGDPVEQVRAPELFNPLFKRHGVNAVLVPVQVARPSVQAFVRQVLGASSVEGLWLTIPLKSEVLPLLTTVDALGTVAQAVNAVRRRADGALEGALFDGQGFVKGLDLWGVALRGRRALVVGVGGAGVAIAVSLAERGAAHIGLYDPNLARSEAVAGRLRAAYGVGIEVLATPDPVGFDVVINATPLGLKAGDPLAFDVNRLGADCVVVDILMKNQPTPLLKACAARGVQAYPGFEMMIQQAAEYLRYFGFEAMAQAVSHDDAELRAMFQSPAFT